MRKVFEVGDKVRCHKWSGVAEIIYITSINDMCYDDYVITVKTKQRTQFYFTLDGKLDRNDAEATLRHAKTGSAAVVGDPPERFEYPIYRRSKAAGTVVEFTGVTTGTVLVSGTLNYRVGETLTTFLPHLDDWWEPCSKPKWRPTKPTWCWVWDDCYDARVLLLVIKYCEHPEGAPSETDYNYVVYNPSATRMVYRNAEPCKEDEIPNYWPREWT